MSANINNMNKNTKTTGKRKDHPTESDLRQAERANKRLASELAKSQLNAAAFKARLEVCFLFFTETFHLNEYNKSKQEAESLNSSRLAEMSEAVKNLGSNKSEDLKALFANFEDQISKMIQPQVQQTLVLMSSASQEHIQKLQESVSFFCLL